MEQEQLEQLQQIIKEIVKAETSSITSVLEQQKLAQMSEDEQKEHLLSERERELAEKESEIKLQQLKATAARIVTEQSLPLEVAELVRGNSESEISLNVMKLKRIIASQSNRHATSSSQITVNPFAKETFSLTEQGRLFRDNPEEARRLAAAAGYKLNF